MAQSATATVKAIKRDFPFSWEGRDKKGKRLKGRSIAPDRSSTGAPRLAKLGLDSYQVII